MQSKSCLLLVSIIASVCESAPVEFRLDDSSLELAVAATPSSISSGEVLAATFNLFNRSTSPLRVCRTSDWGFERTAGIPGRRMVSSHLGCSDAAWVTTEPGGSIAWHEPLGRIPDCNRDLPDSPAFSRVSGCPGEHPLSVYVVVFVTNQARCSRKRPCLVRRLEGLSAFVVR